MEHCTPDMKAFWVAELAKHNITVKLPNGEISHSRREKTL